MSTVSRSSIANKLLENFTGERSKGLTIMRKLMDGRALTEAERTAAAAAGLTEAVADLVNAQRGAMAAQGTLATSHKSIDVANKLGNVRSKAAEADRVFAEQSAAYARASGTVKNSAVGRAAARTRPSQDRLFGYAGDALKVTGLAVSAVALPAMAKKAATSFGELKALIHDPTATTDQRLDKAEELTRAGAGTIFAAQGVKMGLEGTLGILARNRFLGSIINGFSGSAVVGTAKSPLARAFSWLTPLADGAVFLGEAIATRRTFNSTTATADQKLRKSLDVSLAGIKIARWVFPQVRFFQAAYNLASAGQLGLMLWDFKNYLMPKLKHAGQVLLWGVTHPVAGWQALKTGLSSLAATASQKATAALDWTASKVLHPVATWQSFWSEVSAWNRNLLSRLPFSSLLGVQPVPGAIAPAPATLPAPAPVTSQPAVQPLVSQPVSAVPGATDPAVRGWLQPQPAF